MTVEEAIAFLQTLPPQARFLVRGYEHGADEVSTSDIRLVEAQKDRGEGVGNYNGIYRVGAHGWGERPVFQEGSGDCRGIYRIDESDRNSNPVFQAVLIGSANK